MAGGSAVQKSQNGGSAGQNGGSAVQKSQNGSAVQKSQNGSAVQKVQKGLSELSVADPKKWSDQMSSNSSQNGGDDVPLSSIAVVDKTKSTHYEYIVNFHNDKIQTTVTHTASVVDGWISSIYNDFPNKLNNLVVGLDIEWRRIRDNSARNPVAVLQLCTLKRCLIFQISCCDHIPQSLHDFLGNEKFTFVGAGIDGDAHKLWTDHALNVARTEELGSLAAFKLTKTVKEYRDSYLYKDGLRRLSNAVLGQDLWKRRDIQLSHWDNAFLTDNQVEYACVDAYASFKIGVNLFGRSNPVHRDDRRGDRRFYKDFDALKKEEETNQVSDDKKQANGSSKKQANGTKSNKRV